MEKYWTELRWLAFQIQYCLGGGNLFDSRLCSDFRPWGIAVIAVIAAVVFVLVWTWVARKLRDWRWRVAQARVANKATMDRYRWTGDDAKR